MMSVVNKLLLFLMVGCWCVNVTAGEEAEKHHKSRKAEMSRFSEGASLSLDEVVTRVREQTGGRILSADEVDSEYRVRVLTGDGKVRRFRVDPATGDIFRRRR